MDKYEKLYNEALEQAKKELAICGSMDCDAARQIFRFFPQLKESEDERIRKALIDALTVSETIGELKYRLPYPTREECIAYLEKQKEPHYTKRNALFDKCVAECDPAVMKEVSDEIDEMLEKEHKPVEWNEEEYGRLFDIEHYLDGTLQLSPDRKIACIDFLKSLRPSWKPSEEDIKILEHIIGQYETGNKNSKVMGYLPRVEELNFLKKILDIWKN